MGFALPIGLPLTTTPLSIFGSQLYTWLDATNVATGATMVVSDLSGNGRSISGSSAPTLTQGGDGNQPYFLFTDGGTQHLDGAFSPPDPFEIFIVSRTSPTATPRYCVEWGTSGSPRGIGMFTTNLIQISPQEPTNVSLTANAPHVIDAIVSSTGASSSLAVDGGAPQAGNTNSTAANTIRVGSREDGAATGWPGRIYLIVIATSVTSGQRQAMNRYCGQRFQFSVP